jgi:hypothetical protein
MFVPFSFFSTQLPSVPKPTSSYSFDSSSLLSWPSSTTGYTEYNGVFSSIDDGYTSIPILALSNFNINNEGATNQIFVSTNGYITLGEGSGEISGGPQIVIGPLATIAGNPGDLYLEPGRGLDDGDTQNLYYTTGSNGDNKSYIKFIVYSGVYQDESRPSSYLLNLYIDNIYQWVETRVKSNTFGITGPYNSPSVAQPSSTISKVWRGDLAGQNWVYLGTGSVYS